MVCRMAPSVHTWGAITWWFTLMDSILDGAKGSPKLGNGQPPGGWPITQMTTCWIGAPVRSLGTTLFGVGEHFPPIPGVTPQTA